MSPPDSSKRASSWKTQPFSDGSSAFSLENYSDVTEVAKTLSQLGGGAVALDLALDLVLNEVVDQARLATGATGASVALARDGEMVCRASSGEQAPELGVRIETGSGLSGECLKTGHVQHCSDTETDPRVDSEACRQLGIRSALLLPLSDADGSFGILQAFSSRPNVFGERDINTLKALAGRILASKKAAEKGVANNDAPAEPHIPEPLPVITNPAPGPAEDPKEIVPFGMHFAQEPPPGSDIWTTVLVVLVIGAAITLGVIIGWRGALQGWVQQTPGQRGAAHSSAQQLGPESTPAPAPADNSSTLRLSRGAGQEARDTNASIPQAKRATPASAPTQPSGGLTVTENGKVVYRLRGKPIPGETVSPTVGEPEGTRLIHRVAPEYPQEAWDRHIQGSVVLNVQVLGNGSVGNIEIAAGDPVLAESAVRAVRQWKYQPYVVEGQPTQSQTRITIRFSLPPS